MAKSWYSYSPTAPTTAPARTHTSNYALISSLPACGATTRPCAILATPGTGTQPISPASDGTISTNLKSYLASAVGTAVKFPSGTGVAPFFYIKA